MARGHVDPGKTMTFANETGADIFAGSVVVVGDIIGIALGNIANGDTGEIGICEQWKLSKEARLVIPQGEKVYYDTTAKTINLTSTNPFAGIAMLPSAASETMVNVLINGR